MEAIEKQFHHLLRTIPENGLIISPYENGAIEKVLTMGSWTPKQQFGIGVSEDNCERLSRNTGWPKIL